MATRVRSTRVTAPGEVRLVQMSAGSPTLRPEPRSPDSSARSHSATGVVSPAARSLGTCPRHEDPPAGYAARRPGRGAIDRGDTKASSAPWIGDVREVSRSRLGATISSILTIDEVPSNRAARCRWLTETIEPPNRGVASMMNPHEHRYQPMTASLLFIPLRFKREPETDGRHSHLGPPQHDCYPRCACNDRG
jgi:hypothetical protein